MLKADIKQKFDLFEEYWTPKIVSEVYIVPTGVDHLPIAEEDCWVMLIEPNSTKHTGFAQTEQTMQIDAQEWI